MELYLAADLPTTVERMSIATMALATFLFVAGIVAWFVESGARKALRKAGTAFAQDAFKEILRAAEKVLPDARTKRGSAREGDVVAELREIRLATGEILDGWARVAVQPGFARRLIGAGIVTLVVSASMLVALLALDSPSRATDAAATSSGLIPSTGT